MKKSILSPILAIVLIAAILLGTNFALAGMRNEIGQAEHITMMQTLLPGSTDFVVVPYSGEDANIVSVHKGENGFVIETTTAGYAGSITMLIGVSSEGRVTGLVVRDMHETYGLGAQALTDVDFLVQFLNTGGELEVGTDVDALTGATVTSKAVARCVNSAVAYVTGADTATGAT